MKALIRTMARNGVAANLLMVFILFAGAVSALTIPQKMFPEFTLGRIEVRVEYRGATPEEVEQSIVQPIEEQIEAIEGIREVTATAAEGMGVVIAELRSGADVNQKLDEIQSRINRITSFPDRAEEPEVRELTNRRRVIEIVLYGDVPERTLKELAYRVEDELAQKEVLSFVQTSGVRDYEIGIEVPQDALRALGLSLPEVARIVGASSLDLPGGDIDTGRSEILVRVEGENLTADDFAAIILVATEAGAQIRLGDVATIDDGFRDSGLVTRYNGQPAAVVEVFRTGQEQVPRIADAVDSYLDGLHEDLPHGVSAEIWRSSADQYRSRLDLLLENGAVGAALVLLMLALFLRFRVAFWVAAGIVVAFVGTFAVMNLTGTSINMLSLFGFILALGIVVDDAIIVGENVHARVEAGEEGVDAAVNGTTRVAAPVLFAVTTTILAFAPLLFLPGTIGKFLADIPVVVITVLALSLVESLFILPHHLSGLRRPQPPKTRGGRAASRIKRGADRLLKRFVDGPLDRTVGFACEHYGVVLAGFLGVMILIVGLFVGGYLRFVFFPEIEGEYVTAQFEMQPGTTSEATLEFARRLVEGGLAAARSEAGDAAGGEDAGSDPGSGPIPPPLDRVVDAYQVVVGRQLQAGGPSQGGGAQVTQPNAGAVQFRMASAGGTGSSAQGFADAWREATGPMPVADYVSYSASLVEAGSPVSVELSHPDAETLDRVVERLKGELGSYEGVFDIYDTRDEGQRELEVRILDRARSFGFTLEDIANQVRAAFFGAEALRVQRGREEVRVYVRLPEHERASVADLLDYRIRGPQGDHVPLAEVARVSYEAGPSAISRRNGRRIVTVAASVQEGITTGEQVTNRLEGDVLPAIRSDHPKLAYEFGGAQRERSRTLPALLRNFGIALFAIYALLAVSFRSYLQPLIIVAIVPFGMAGAAHGHLVLGLDITFLSLFGIVGLAGVVINDALILLDFANARRLGGAPMREAVVGAAKARFRPILLTSVTTFLGVAPIMFSQSVQARFLVPLATSIAFGIVFATALQMLLVPALAQLHFDGQRWFSRRVLGRRDAPVVHGSPGGGAG